MGHGRICSEYNCRGRLDAICSDDLLCSGDVVTIKRVKELPWKQCFPLALALVAYLEVSVTMFVLCFVFCVTKGPCWMRQRGTRSEIIRVSTRTGRDLRSEIARARLVLPDQRYTTPAPTVC